jgi:hypothetical protein
MRKNGLFACMATLGVAAAANAQLSSIGPFTGSMQEGFEAVPSYSCPPCFLPCLTDVFGDTAEMCDANGGNGMHITGGWSFQCQIGPHAGVRLFGSAGGPTLIKFDDTVTKFGAYMGDNGLQLAGTAEFFDNTGAAIGSAQALSLDGCNWRWNGWESSTPIKSVKITGAVYGGHILLDDMEAEPESTCYPDCNKSGTLTIADFGCFQAAFAAGEPYADCNNSGGLTIADFGCFQAAFATGCP